MVGYELCRVVVNSIRKLNDRYTTLNHFIECDRSRFKIYIIFSFFNPIQTGLNKCDDRRQLGEE